jgi:hypothetical protein
MVGKTHPTKDEIESYCENPDQLDLRKMIESHMEHCADCSLLVVETVKRQMRQPVTSSKPN